MDFWWFMFVFVALIPIIMILSGRMMWKHPPKRINGIIGYRSMRSMKNIDTWKFAHDYCGRLWWKIGWAVLFPSMVIHSLFYNNSENTIGVVDIILCTVQVIALIVPFYITESALKKNFDDKGIRK